MKVRPFHKNRETIKAYILHSMSIYNLLMFLNVGDANTQGHVTSDGFEKQNFDVTRRRRV